MKKRAKTLPGPSRSLPSVSLPFMKMILTLVFVCAALLAGGCGDQSLLTDEEYRASRGPAPYPSDPTRHMPQTPSQRSSVNRY